MKIVYLIITGISFFLVTGVFSQGEDNSVIFELPSSRELEPRTFSLISSILCNDIETDEPLVAERDFSVLDNRIILWFKYRLPGKKVIVSCYWIRESRTRFVSSTWLTSSNGVYWFTMESPSFRNDPGNWQVEIRVGDDIIFKKDFIIQPKDSVSNIGTTTNRSGRISDDVTMVDIPERNRNDILPPTTGKVIINMNTGRFNRGNLKPRHPLYSNLTVSGLQFPSWAEYDIEVPMSGKYELWWYYTAGEPRPAKIYFDGILQTDHGLGEVTGGWYEDSLKWFKELDLYISKGSHVLRIDNAGYIPCMKKFVLAIVSS